MLRSHAICFVKDGDFDAFHLFNKQLRAIQETTRVAEKDGMKSRQFAATYDECVSTLNQDPKASHFMSHGGLCSFP
jgi:hypothetical protein